MTADQLSEKIRSIVETQVVEIENSPGIDPGVKLDMLAKVALILQRIRVPSSVDPSTGKTYTDKQLMERSGGLQDE